jgi:hypothetical protein
MDGGMAGAGDGGASAQGPSTGTTYKFGVKPGQGANREDLGGKKKRKSLPTMPASTGSTGEHITNERTRPARKRPKVTGGSTFPADGSR